jgi:hypothetical protein
MAYFNQQMKKERTPAIKAVLAKYNMKGTMSVDNHSTFVVTLKSGAIDFGKEHEQVNTYWIDTHYEDNQIACKFLSELKEAMNIGNYDNSNSQIDYFDVGYYIDINIGKWNKPYVVVE